MFGHAPEDHDLVERAQQGDSEAIEELYARYLDRMRRYLTRALGDRHEAEDLAHRVFIRLIAALPSLDRGAPALESWLFRIARNMVIDHVRSLRSEPRDPAALVDRIERFGPALPPPLPELLSASAFDELLTCVTPLQRQVLALRYQLDFPFARIATALGSTEVAVRKAHHQGLQALRARTAGADARTSSRRIPFAMTRLDRGRPADSFTPRLSPAAARVR